jgi:NAD(P)-dependent dehydrogenase (short-subunit alcohol dehydrogenase family)
MIARGSGVVVNLSSGWGRSVSGEFAPYCASKWGVEGLTKALAEELPAPLAAIPLSPGVIDTAMLRQCYDEAAGEYAKPAEWAKVAAPFLLGLSRKENGESLTVPGF